MLEHKSYKDILRFKNEFIDYFIKGDYIIVQEKIDSSNASFQYDIKEEEIKSFSRNTILTDDNNLWGFYNYAKNLDKNIFKKYPNYRFFGEWTGWKHKVSYPEEVMKKIWIFDIYDTTEQKYLPWNQVKAIATECNLNVVPVFYEGEFTNWEDIINYAGKTKLGGEIGEGVVVKNMTRLNCKNCYTKIVSEQFSEIKKSKKHDIKLSSEKQKLYEDAETIVTKNRVEKILMKLIDEGCLRPNWNEEDMKIISSNLPKLMYADCIKEESEIVNKIGKKFGNICAKISMNYVRKMLNER